MCDIHLKFCDHKNFSLPENQAASTMSRFVGDVSKVTTFVRGKKTSAITGSTQKVVNQLSALSASRKQPKLVKLNQEDLIKHNTIQNAWRSYSRKQHNKQQQQLQKQYESIVSAMEALKSVNPLLYEVANKQETKNLYPLGLRIPTDFPPNEPWVYNYKK